MHEGGETFKVEREKKKWGSPTLLGWAELIKKVPAVYNSGKE